MTWLLLAGLGFGFVHPGCKWITATGLPLLPFCLLFVLSRILFQLPVVWKNGGASISGKRQLTLLIALGLVGAGLRLTEFLGIVEGLPVSLVSFLIYLHPVWTILFSRWLNAESIDAFRLFKIFCALVGTALLVDLTAMGNVQHYLHLWSPIAAGVLISLWICLSTRAQKEGASVVSVAFYYDLFTLVPLLIMSFFTMDAAAWRTTVDWIVNPQHLLIMSGFTLLTGVLPNYSFYYGLKKATAMAAALLMLFEPIASSLIAVWAWNEPISTSFYWGAILILMINIPDAYFRMLFAKSKTILPRSYNRTRIARAEEHPYSRR